MNVRGICLDAGGVLQMPDSDLVLRVLAPLGFESSREDMRAAHYLAMGRSEGHATVFDYNLWLRHYTEALGVPEDRLDDATVRIRSAFEDGQAWSEVVPGAPEALRELASRKLRISIISNTVVGGAVVRSLREAGLCQVGEGPGTCVDAVLDSSELGMSKPDPRIFHAAMDAMGTTAEETVHMGDSLSADVRGASAAGIRPIHYDPMHLCTDRSHPHLADIRALGSLLDSMEAAP